MKADIDQIGIRGSLETMSAYLGDAQIYAEEFVKHKPVVPIGLLKALGIEANSVPLPTEDPISLVMNVTESLMKIIDDETKNMIEFVEVGTESIKDGSLPMSQYALKFLNSDDIISNESKHACVAAVNAIWRNATDNGIVISSDIATYGDDETTAPSAEFTGGAGSTAMLLKQGGRLLDILNVRGASSGLTHDFYKPYLVDGFDLSGKVYPVVFGKYSNLANIERVGKAYENLKKKVNDLSLDKFSGIVLHTPYPGITKYNLAYMVLIDQKDQGIKEAVSIYEEINNLIDQAHDGFKERDFDYICDLEVKVKKYLKNVMYQKDEDGNKFKAKTFLEQQNKLKPSLEFIKYVGNIYTGSSPLCMMSLLENKAFNKDEYILWGGYGSGNQAIFMIAKTKEDTEKIVSEWQTGKKLKDRKELTAEEYGQMKKIIGTPYDEIDEEAYGDIVNIAKPRNSYYISNCDEFHIKQYERAYIEEKILNQ